MDPLAAKPQLLALSPNQVQNGTNTGVATPYAGISGSPASFQPAASLPNTSFFASPATAQISNAQQPVTPDDLGQPPLWTWAAGTVAGLPAAWFLNNYLFGATKDGSRYRIYKVVSFIDNIPGISHISHGIDSVGEWFRSKTGTPETTTGKLPQWLKKPADKVVKAADPYLQQFLHQATELDALKLHADDYIGMLSHLETQQGAHGSNTIANLKKRVETLYTEAQKHAGQNSQVATNRFYKGLSTELLRSARQVVDEPATVKQILNPQTLAQLSPELRKQVADIAANAKNIDHARVKLFGLRMGKMFSFTSDGRTLGALSSALNHQRNLAWQLQESKLVKQYLSDSVLKNANLTPEQIARFHQAKTVKEAQTLVKPGLLGRIGSPLTSDQRKQLAEPFKALQNEHLLRKRLYGVYGRLQGIKQFHLTFYGQERAMSRDMRKVAGSQYTGKKIGVIGRTLATWAKALRDMVDGSVAGASNGGKLNIARMLPNSKTLLPAVLMGMFLMTPIYEAHKAEKGDKVKTFFYHLLGAEFGMMIGWQVGSLLFNEFHAPSNIAKGVDKVLNKVGIRSSLKTAMFRFTKWPFFTLSGFLGAFFLPSFITGSMFSKRGEKLSTLIFGKPKSISEKEHQEKFQSLTEGQAAISSTGMNTPLPNTPQTNPLMRLPIQPQSRFQNQPATPNPKAPANLPTVQTQAPSATAAPVLTHPAVMTKPEPVAPQSANAQIQPQAPKLAPKVDASALEKLISQYTHPEANSNTYYGGLNTVDPTDIPATPASSTFAPRYA